MLPAYRDKAMVLARSELWLGLRCFVFLEIFICGMAAEPVGLRADRVINPPAIQAPKPLLSWELSSPGFQSAYQIQAASSKENLLKHKNLKLSSIKVI